MEREMEKKEKKEKRMLPWLEDVEAPNLLLLPVIHNVLEFPQKRRVKWKD